MSDLELDNGGVGKGQDHPLDTNFFSPLSPLVKIFFSFKPSAAIIVKDGSYTFCYESIELLLDKIMPALQANIVLV